MKSLAFLIKHIVAMLEVAIFPSPLSCGPTSAGGGGS